MKVLLTLILLSFLFLIASPVYSQDKEVNCSLDLFSKEFDKDYNSLYNEYGAAGDNQTLLSTALLHSQMFADKYSAYEECDNLKKLAVQTKVVFYSFGSVISYTYLIFDQYQDAGTEDYIKSLDILIREVAIPIHNEEYEKLMNMFN